VTAALPALPLHVLKEIAAQRAALQHRVEESGLYQHELDEFEVAVAALPHLHHRMEITEDRGSLTTPESRNLVRRVLLRDGSTAVLKVIGNTREPGEGELLDAWYRAGLPCVQPLSWGYLRVMLSGSEAAVPHTASYLLTRFVTAHHLPEPRTAHDRAKRVRDLVALVRPFHAANVPVSRARSWGDRVGQHLRQTLPLLQHHGLQEPNRWEDKLDRLSRDGRIVVHGDPAGLNVLGTDRGLLLLDPPGALVALPEADIAQICCQVGGVSGARELLTLVSEEHAELDPSALAGFAGLNLLIWAGYILAKHSNPDVKRASTCRVSPHRPGGSAGADGARHEAEWYLRVSCELLEEYRLT